MKIVVLGSGTSSGVPVIGCSCKVCSSNDPKDKRLRSSIYIILDKTDVTDNDSPRHILIDVGPDFREQALRYKIDKIDAIFFTHAHADHIFGLDDIRMFNFIQKKSIPVYAEEQTSKDLLRIFGYCFQKNPKYEGGGVPNLNLNIISDGDIIKFGSTEIKALRAYHGSLPVLGYKINKFAYLTDCSIIPEDTSKEIDKITHLILDGLRHRPHKTHLTIEKAIEFVLSKKNPPRTYLTHLSHEVSHVQTDNEIYKKTNGKVSLAYDGLACIIHETPLCS